MTLKYKSLKLRGTTRSDNERTKGPKRGIGGAKSQSVEGGG